MTSRRFLSLATVSACLLTTMLAPSLQGQVGKSLGVVDANTATEARPR